MHGPLRAVARRAVGSIAVQYGDKLKVVKINTDESSEVAMKHGIMSIPTGRSGRSVRELEPPEQVRDPRHGQAPHDAHRIEPVEPSQ